MVGLTRAAEGRATLRHTGTEIPAGGWIVCTALQCDGDLVDMGWGAAAMSGAGDDGIRITVTDAAATVRFYTDGVLVQTSSASAAALGHGGLTGVPVWVNVLSTGTGNQPVVTYQTEGNPLVFDGSLVGWTYAPGNATVQIHEHPDQEQPDSVGVIEAYGWAGSSAPTTAADGYPAWASGSRGAVGLLWGAHPDGTLDDGDPLTIDADTEVGGAQVWACVAQESGTITAGGLAP